MLRFGIEHNFPFESPKEALTESLLTDRIETSSKNVAVVEL